MTFVWTTPALLAGAKTTARQPWSDRVARRYRAGMLVKAYDKLARHGGRLVGVVQLTEDPVREPLAAMPDEAYETEGWRWLHEHRELLPGWVRESDFSWEGFERWRSRPGEVWVVRFRLVAVASDQIGEALAEGLAQGRAAARAA